MSRTVMYAAIINQAQEVDLYTDLQGLLNTVQDDRYEQYQKQQTIYIWPHVKHWPLSCIFSHQVACV